MANVFIVRAFGNKRPVIKKNKEGNPEIVFFDFDKVESDLIKPAMKELGLSGGTTGEVFEAGDIREDMFSELLLADIVIADITIYNANVFYELGIRHALRDKRTILIKCAGYDETPFDIIGYRYVSYDQANPAGALPALIQTFEETMKADRKDSPVFNVLPQLESQDPEKYLALPKDFIEEVQIVESTKSAGRLALLAYEAGSFSWQIPALRHIGEALYKLKVFETAKFVWEKIRNNKPRDIQANDRLATIYQRLAENEMKLNPDEANALFAKSDMAIETLISNDKLSAYQMAEAYSLKARNAKTQWLNSWKDLSGNELRLAALQSLYLESAINNYEKGFFENLNHFYSGINALGLITTLVTLAEKNPETWELAFDTKEEADQKLTALKNKYTKLSTVVQISIEAAKIKQDEKGKPDIWLSITEADFLCLTSSNPARVGNMYTKVLQAAGGLSMEATIRQLKIYERLEVKPENVTSALLAIPPAEIQQKQTNYFLLFTGHMIDKPDRTETRFPASKEAVVRQQVKEKIMEVQRKMKEGYVLTGIAGGACGGDILFHEICGELGIATQMYLALPREQFLVESVAFAGPEWIERFDNLYNKLPHPVLSDNAALPKWLQKKADYNIWVRNNLWELNGALVNGGMNMTLIALWDGKGADGPGGTEHMVKEANSRGSKVLRIDTATI